MKIYDELVARGLIAQVTNEDEIRNRCKGEAAEGAEGRAVDVDGGDTHKGVVHDDLDDAAADHPDFSAKSMCSVPVFFAGISPWNLNSNCRIHLTFWKIISNYKKY